MKRLADYIVMMKDGKDTGCYEKDQLIDNWRRIWIKPSTCNLENTLGVIQIKYESELIELVTMNHQQTDAVLKANNIEVYRTASLELREILRQLLELHEKGDVN